MTAGVAEKEGLEEGVRLGEDDAPRGAKDWGEEEAHAERTRARRTAAPKARRERFAGTWPRPILAGLNLILRIETLLKETVRFGLRPHDPPSSAGLPRVDAHRLLWAVSHKDG
jgi:hypothetical protein